MIAIGLAGPSKSGKTTLAAELKRYGFTRVAFADALRYEVFEAFCHNQPREVQEEVTKLLYDRTNPDKERIRPLLQAWGQLRRDLAGENYWVLRLDESIQHLPLVVIDDVRYPNEAEYVRTDLKGIVVTLLPEKEPSAGAHPSETEYTRIRADLELPRLPVDQQVSLVFGILRKQPRRSFCCSIAGGYDRDQLHGIVVFDQQTSWWIYRNSAGMDVRRYGEQADKSFEGILKEAAKERIDTEYYLTTPRRAYVDARSYEAVRAFAKAELGHDAVD